MASASSQSAPGFWDRESVEFQCFFLVGGLIHIYWNFTSIFHWKIPLKVIIPMILIDMEFYQYLFDILIIFTITWER